MTPYGLDSPVLGCILKK